MWRRSPWLVEQTEDAAQRDAHPGGPAAELVAQLVDALLEQQHRQRHLPLLARVRQQARALGVVAVGAQERGPDPARPEHRPALQACRILPRRDPARAQALERRVRRVIEGADHAGYVAQRRALQPPLRQRPRGLALEVGDEEVVAGPQDLSEVQIAVAPDAHTGQLAADDPPTALDHAILGAQQAIDIGRELGGKRLLLLAELPEHLAHQVAQRLVARALVEQAERL